MIPLNSFVQPLAVCQLRSFQSLIKLNTTSETKSRFSRAKVDTNYHVTSTTATFETTAIFSQGRCSLTNYHGIRRNAKLVHLL